MKPLPKPKGSMLRVLRELVGLFVDDGALAIGIIVWVALMGMLIGWLPWPMIALGMLLFVGPGALLAYSASRAVRRAHGPVTLY